MMEVARNRPKCSQCGAAGHYVKTCPDSMMMRKLDDVTTARIAVMREECDALATETTQYEQVMAVMSGRVAENHRRMIDLQKAIATLRGGA